MGSNNVVSIRVEALGVSITIADGNIAIERIKAEPAAVAMPKGARFAVASQLLPPKTRPGFCVFQLSKAEHHEVAVIAAQRVRERRQ